MSNLFPVYQRWEIQPAEANGSTIIDKNGKEYLDFTSGIGVCNLGHRPEAVEAAVKEQLGNFWHVSNLFEQSGQEKAASLLCEYAGMDRAYFANSGAEANEAAIKLARKATGKTKIITFLNSFHGRTFAAMSATGQEKIKHGYGPMLETFVYVPFNDIDAVKKSADGETAAVMLEMVQGEGGIHIADKAFVSELAAFCKEKGILLIIDEIQTGIGRTAKPFAYMHFDIQPDIITSAKGLGSGLPIGAMLGKEHLAEAFGPGSHGSTFGGNPIAIAAASATLAAVMNDGFSTELEQLSESFKSVLLDILTDIPGVKDIRIFGMMAGIELATEANPVLQELREKGLIALPAGTHVIRLLPPLTCTMDQIEKAAGIIAETLQASASVHS
jgi:acetylornithine/N-succinyldiaminopimelate aminotransferase